VEVPTPTPVEVAPETTETPIEPTETPLAVPDRGEWHLIDLLIVAITMALGIYLMLYALRRKDEFDDETTSRGRQIRMWGQLGVLLAIVSVIVLLLTQTFTGDMKIIDIWSVLFAVILGVEILAIIGIKSSKKQERPEEWEVEESGV
jgi:archaellum biogenesis protein FlaJ (TadC family)